MSATTQDVEFGNSVIRGRYINCRIILRLERVRAFLAQGAPHFAASFIALTKSTKALSGVGTRRRPG